MKKIAQNLAACYLRQYATRAQAIADIQAKICEMQRFRVLTPDEVKIMAIRQAVLQELAK